MHPVHIPFLQRGNTNGISCFAFIQTYFEDEEGSLKNNKKEIY